MKTNDLRKNHFGEDDCDNAFIDPEDLKSSLFSSPPIRSSSEKSIDLNQATYNIKDYIKKHRGQSLVNDVNCRSLFDQINQSRKTPM